MPDGFLSSLSLLSKSRSSSHRGFCLSSESRTSSLIDFVIDCFWIGSYTCSSDPNSGTDVWCCSENYHSWWKVGFAWVPNELSRVVWETFLFFFYFLFCCPCFLWSLSLLSFIFSFFLIFFLFFSFLSFFLDLHAGPCGLTFTWWGCCGVCFWHKPTELAHSFSLCTCLYVCLSGPLNRISFHKFFRQLSAFSLCSFGLISAVFVLSAI